MSGKKTLKSAMRNNLISTLIFLCIGVVCIVVANLLKIESILIKYGLIIIGVTFVLTAIGLFTMVRSRAKKNYCKKCGEKYDYNRDIEWTQESEENTGKAIWAHIAFRCVCNNCGNERTFNRNFRTAYLDDKGNIHRNNLEALIRNAFKY